MDAFMTNDNNPLPEDILGALQQVTGIRDQLSGMGGLVEDLLARMRDLEARQNARPTDLDVMPQVRHIT